MTPILNPSRACRQAASLVRACRSPTFQARQCRAVQTPARSASCTPEKIRPSALGLRSRRNCRNSHRWPEWAASADQDSLPNRRTVPSTIPARPLPMGHRAAMPGNSWGAGARSSSKWSRLDLGGSDALRDPRSSYLGFTRIRGRQPNFQVLRGFAGPSGSSERGPWLSSARMRVVTPVRRRNS